MLTFWLKKWALYVGIYGNQTDIRRIRVKFVQRYPISPQIETHYTRAHISVCTHSTEFRVLVTAVLTHLKPWAADQTKGVYRY